MFKNYFKTAWRNLIRHRFTFFINLFGITVGITCCLLVLSYIINELSYDQFKNSDNIYRVTRSFYTESGRQTLHLGAVAPPIGPLLQNDFPDIKEITRLLPLDNSPFKYENKLFNEKAVFAADTNFFDFFSVPVLAGNPKTALAAPFTMMLTPEVAKKYFGNENPINKAIEVNVGRKYFFKVTGIYKPFPPNAHLHPDILLSFSTLKDSSVYGENNLETNWGNNAFYTYLMFPPNYPVKNIENQFPAFLNKHFHFSGMPYGFIPSKTTKLHLQKLLDIHLRSNLDSEIESNGDINKVYIFAAIALFILLIACINYMNLATAHSILRAKEIGIRKAIGADRRQVALQFLGESILIAFAALILALALTSLLLPYLSRISDRQLTMHLLLHWKIIIPVLILPVIVGFISGIYPALFMSAFNPVKVLKGFLKAGSQTIPLRQALVVLQFAIAIVLIIATAVVFRQLRYIENASLGFNKDHILTMSYNHELDKRYESFRAALVDDPNIKDLGLSSRIPSVRLLDEQGVSIPGDTTRSNDISLKNVEVNEGFIPTYQIAMVAGRNFNPKEFASDSTNYIINEDAVKMLGWQSAQNAIGKDLKYGGIKGKIIGVMKNFHFESMHQPVIPLIFAFGSPKNNSFNDISIKISGANIHSTINKIKGLWESFMPDVPFSYSFLDARFARLYYAEEREELIFTIFSCIAIFIGCLGLFGLSAFIISQRTKEIGIRKVLGASSTSIVGILSKDFLKLVAIAAFIALPIGWFCMDQWLTGFAYHIKVEWWLLLLAALLAAVIALITISFQAVKAAKANPIKSLRTE